MHHSPIHSFSSGDTQKSANQRPPQRLYAQILLWLYLASNVTSTLVYANDEHLYFFDTNSQKDTITRIAAKTGLLTPYTSLIGVDKSVPVPSDEGGKDFEVNPLNPKVNGIHSVLSPQGAYDADTWTLLSFLCAAAGVLLIVFSRSPWRSGSDVISA